MQVYYNNLLSLPPILGLMWFFGEFEGLTAQPALHNPMFLMVSAMGGLIGFLISFSSLWFLSQTTVSPVGITTRRVSIAAEQVSLPCN